MALPILKFNVDDVKVLRFRQLEADGTTPVDITGFVYTWFAREKAGDTAFTLGPETATITNATNGQFTFEVTMPSTKTNSLYWVERVDGDLKPDTSPPAEGTEIRVLEK